MDNINNKIEMTLENITKKGALSRNMKCPCGSGQKIKYCHKNILEFRHMKTQQQINHDVQQAELYKKIGLTKSQYEQKILEEKEMVELSKYLEEKYKNESETSI